MTESEIFNVARKLLDSDREPYLLGACGDDVHLKERVLRLLEAHFEIEPTLNSSVQSSTQKADVSLSPGQSFGPFRLLQPLGQGGMGNVWKAEQLDPVKREVALKVIRSGIGSKEVVARFEAERQALALMNHPNVARILDAGRTPDGHPYFAMELVQGRPLTKYCDEHCLPINARLELFAEICIGVQHAHQKGILHRDLKPSNILVSEIDGKPVPKVIDFGLAKSIESEQRLTEESISTEIGQVLGTLKYMSPEQAGLNSGDIDTRTDIYALGVILYELLTGSTPVDESTMKGQSTFRILEIIRNNDPVKPSRKLIECPAEQLSSITRSRKTDGGHLTRVFAGDLDWIVMRALEKDPARRYLSASGFAADIRRFLEGEPVVARPPSLNYRISKFVRRNRIGVVAASAILMALVIGIVFTSVEMLRAMKAERLADERLERLLAATKEESRQRGLAEQGRLEAERERAIAETRRVEAEQNLAFAKKGNEILGAVFSGLDPNAEFSTVAELRNALRKNLERAGEELGEAAIGDSQTVAQMQMNLGRSLLALAQPDSAMLLFEQAMKTLSETLGPDHEDTLESVINLASAYRDAGQVDKAILLLKHSIERSADNLGPEHPMTLSMTNCLAMCYGVAGKIDVAIPLLEKTLEIHRAKFGADHTETQNILNNLANNYRTAGRTHEAIPLLEELYRSMKSKAASHEPDLLVCMNSLGMAYLDESRMDEAFPLLEETLALRKSSLGIEHRNTLTSMNNLALWYESSGQHNKALPMYEQTLELRKANLGQDHPHTLTSMSNLARCYKRAGQVEKAIPILESTLELRQKKLGEDHPSTLTSMNNLAEGYRANGNTDKSLALFKRSLELCKAKLGIAHPNTQTIMSNIGAIYFDASQFEESIPYFEAAFEAGQPRFRRDFQRLAIGQSGRELRFDLMFAYAKCRKDNELRTLAEETVRLGRERYLGESPELANLLVNVADKYLRFPLYSEASDLLREGLEIRNAKSADAWTTFNTRSLLGGALMGKAKSTDDTVGRNEWITEAESLLVSGYEGMRDRESSIPPGAQNRISDALDRLIDYYKFTDRPEQIEKYAELRQQYRSTEEASR